MTKKLKIIVILCLLLGAMLLFNAFRTTQTIITTTEANQLLQSHKIQKLTLEGEYLYLYSAKQGYKIYKEALPMDGLLKQYPLTVKESPFSWYDLFSLLIILMAFGALFRFLHQSSLQQRKQIEYAQKGEEAQSTSIEVITPQITFANVAGIKEVKEELEEIIDFLREPQKYRNLDIRLPKGVLLMGPPGVGKTLIAKAVAGEAGVPFFYQSGASFVHIYVGMGAKRVSELFQKAKQMAPSIIFIDEIDAVGKSRGEFRNDEREATLNQLLTEMDGFEESSGVIVIGATNKIEVLDEALLRAGRFDRRIHISLPDLEDRVKTLEFYLQKKPHHVDSLSVARMTVGFNAAALDTLINEAALYAMRSGRHYVETSDIEAVKEKVLLGKRKILSFSEKEREIQAIYQGAKAVLATWLDIEFEKIGLVTTRLMMQEHEILSKSTLLNRMKVYLAGSIATQMHYNEQFSNGSSDIMQAKELVHKIIYEYAMSDNFIVTPQQEEILFQESVKEVNMLLLQLKDAHQKIVNYLLTYENITQSVAQEMIREVF